MRKIWLAIVMLGAVQSAQAADMPDLPVLRGSFRDAPTPTVNWQGYYIGGQAGVGTSNMDFTGSTRTVAAQLLANTSIESSAHVAEWPLLGKTSQHGNGWGGFAGYNSQWDDVVIGLEVSYLHGKFGGSQTDSMGRSFADTAVPGYTDDITYRSSASMSISDMGTLRARAGYAIGSFLPYMFGGFALGQADIVRSVTLTGSQQNPNVAAPFDYIPINMSKTTAQYSHLVYGYSAGVGVDVNLIGGLFLRAEWEYLRFTSAVDTSINTVRAGVGYKF